MTRDSRVAKSEQNASSGSATPMRRRGLLGGAAAVPLASIAMTAFARAEDRPAAKTPEAGSQTEDKRAADGAAMAQDMLPTGTMEVIGALPDPGPSGIAVTPDNRVFLTFPRHAEDHNHPALAELIDGKAVAWPDEKTTRQSSLPISQRLISPHGMTTDAKGRLWLIDDGKIVGHPIPPGAAKIVGYDPGSRTRIANIVLRPPVMLPDSHMNDLRVDLTHGEKGTVFVADSSFGTSPGLVIADVASGRQRRVLTHHPSILPEPGLVAVLEGKPRHYKASHAQFPTGGVDSITLSADSSTLYYSPLTSRRLYSLPTALLSDFSSTDQQLSEAVTDLGEKVLTDGLATDPWNRIYLTAGEHDAIMRRNTDGSIDVIARDQRIIWPDGIFADKNYVYCVLGQWNRLAGFNDGHSLRQPPYLVVRCPISPPTA
ncbi:major royal jelly family protein [Acetobacter musti]|nr:major royal jelly family protein [Acetobacter musti]